MSIPPSLAFSLIDGYRVLNQIDLNNVIPLVYLIPYQHSQTPSGSAVIDGGVSAKRISV